MSRPWAAPRKLVCATDLTTRFNRAVDRAKQLAGQWQASLLALQVVDETGVLGRDDSEVARKRGAVLERDIRRHPAASTIDVDTNVTLGNPAERILGRSDCLYIDLVVMGPGERRSLSQKLLGSTVDHVVRHALRPVLAVRNRVTGPYRKIIVATDFAPASKEALDCALTLFPDAEVTVMHADDASLRGVLPCDVLAVCAAP